MAGKYIFKNPMKTLDEINRYANLYPVEDYGKDKELENSMKGASKENGITKTQLIEIAKWKYSGPILQYRVDKNPTDCIESVSKLAFKITDEIIRINLLRTLHGVDWAMASVILHFVFKGKYPIFDFRAIRTVTGKRYDYCNQTLWIEYYNFYCEERDRLNITDMRTLDQALWTFDKVNNR